MSWNIANNFGNGEQIKRLFVNNNYSYMALQEPTIKFNDETAKYLKAQFGMDKILIIPTPMQYVLIREATLGNNMITSPTILLEGRIIATTFHTNMENTINNNSKQIITIISVYNIPITGRQLKCGKKRKDIRAEIKGSLNKLLATLKDTYPNQGLIVQGDMQDTESTSAIDNTIPERAATKDKNSILTLLTNNNNKLESILFQQAKEEDETYITRTPTTYTQNARGIDHVYTNTQAKNHFIGGGIDSLTALMLLSTDHYILHTEFANTLVRTEGHAKKIMKIYYGKIAKIPLENNSESAPVHPQFDNSLFQSEENKTSATLLENINEYANGMNTKAYKLIIKAENIIKETESIIINATHTLSLHDKGNDNKEKDYKRLIPRKQQYRTNLENALALVMESIDDVCINTGLQREMKDGAETPYVGNHLDTYMPESIKEFEKELERDSLGSSLFKLMMIIKRASHHAKSITMILNRNKNQLHTNRKSHISYNEIKILTYHMKQLTKMAMNKEGITLHQMIEGTTNKLYKQINEWEDNIEAVNNYRDVDPYGTSDNNKVGLLNGFVQEDITHLNDIIKNKTNYHRGILGIDPRMDDNCIDEDKKENKQHKTDVWYNIDFSHTGLNTTSETFYPDNGMIEELDWNIATDSESFLHSLKYTRTCIEELLQQTYTQAKKYRNKRIQFAVKTNNTSLISKIIILKGRDNPEPHNLIKDKTTQQWRTCKSDEERLEGTNQVHSKWIQNSSADKQCLYVDLIKDEVGICGATLHPDREFTDTIAKQLIPNWDHLNKKQQNAINRAHTRKHIRNLFRQPEKYNKEFDWPYYIDDKNNDMFSDTELEGRFYKMIQTKPGKARHKGFTLNVLGRLPIIWQTTVWRIIKIILITRLPTLSIKEFTRVPIPKNAPGETRPLAITHDLYCYICGALAKPFTDAVEKLKILYDELHAYRKDHSCDLITILQATIKEDALQHGKTYIKLDEDEERFFDRVTLDMQLAALLRLGCPPQGYVEMKAEDLLHRTVKIITRLGSTSSTYTCGMPQGAPTSCVFSNCIMLLKHILMRSILNDHPTVNHNCQMNPTHAYQLETMDHVTNSIPRLMSDGFCDDNTRYISTTNDNTLIMATQDYINITGDFSIITKLGRKGRKSAVTVYNMKDKQLARLSEFKSIAWSYETDGVVEEKLQLYIHYNGNSEDILDNSEITDMDKKHIKKLIEKHTDVTWIKHLGITEQVGSCKYSTTSDKQCQAVHIRLKEVRDHDLDGKASATINNSLITSMMGYGTLFSNPTFTQTKTIENEITNMASKAAHKSASTDTKHLTCTPCSKGGSGVKSVTQILSGAKLRELNVILNNHNATTSIALRTRHYAQTKTDGIDFRIKDNQTIGRESSNEGKKNNKKSQNEDQKEKCDEYNKKLLNQNIVSPLLVTNTNWLAMNGFFLRSKEDLFPTAVVEHLMRTLPNTNNVPIGTYTNGQRFWTRDASHLTVEGKVALLKYSTYGTLFTYVR